jgi:AmpD protein
MGPSLKIDKEGWCDGVTIIPSPNYDTRPVNVVIDLLILHHISLPPRIFGGDDVIALFTNTLDSWAHPDYITLHTLRVSAHFFIRRHGEIIQFVACDQRAWHAGVSQWQGRRQCNDFSIGIELEGHEYTPYTEAQYEALMCLLPVLKQRYPLQQIVGHQDVAPNRKTDPGPFFDWRRLDVQWDKERVGDSPGVGSY